MEELDAQCPDAADTLTDETLSVSDRVAADEASPEDAAVFRGFQQAVRVALAGLTDKQRLVLCMRFGIDMDSDHTLEEVGRKFDLTRERIRQIEKKALERLGRGVHSMSLRTFLYQGKQRDQENREASAETEGAEVSMA
jgi:RNA polymerase primary sigma factor